MNRPPLPPETSGSAPERRRRAAVSLMVLAGVSLAFAVLFYQVMRPFALPLFLAAAFAVLAMPLHERVTAMCGGRGWLSALLISLALLILLLAPTTAGFLASYRRAVDAAALLELTVREPGFDESLFDRVASLTHSDPQELRARCIEAIREGERLLFRRAMQALGNAISFGLNACLFLVAGFFFLKDGRTIVETWEGLTPLDLIRDRQIRREFAVICRAVVSSTILASLAQALALGLGLGLIDLVFGLGLARWLVLLVLLSFVCAMIPVLGAPIVWLPLAVWLIYREHYLAGIALALFGAVAVGNVDNLVRMLVLRGSAGIHPLLALVSFLGGVEWMGVIGAFLGPVVAGVFVALLRILKLQLDQFEGSDNHWSRKPG
jgi:predicted PurR-regulated permease PerM